MAAALAGSARAARDATVNEYGLPYPCPVTIAVAPSRVSPSSMNGDQMSQASTCPELSAASPAAGCR